MANKEKIKDLLGKEAQYRIRYYDATLGKRQSLSFVGTEREANKKVTEWTEKEHNIRNGFVPRNINKNTTINQLTKWYNEVGLRWRNLHREHPLDKKTTYLHFKALKQFAKVFGANCPVSNVTSIGYREFYNYRKLNGLNVDIRAMKTVIGTAIAHHDKIVIEMPSDLVTFTVKSSTPRYLEASEVTDILSCDMHEYYKDKPCEFDVEETMRIFNLYWQTGCRLNELITLTWDNVDFKNNTITVIGKRKKVRKIYVTRLAMDIFREISDRDRPLPYTNSKVRDRLKDLNKASGVSFTTHNLRSTCGSFMLSAGCTIEEVSEHLGHSDIQTTRNWYARIIEDKRKSATKKFEQMTYSLKSLPQFVD